MEHYFTNNSNLKSEFRNIIYNYSDYKFNFISDLGVFSKDRVDYGSKLLIETILLNYEKRNINILDVGCGYGFIGIVLSKVLNSKVTMIDINKRAVHLSNMNIKNNNVDGEAFESNIYENIDTKYDLIVSNPPIRAGKNVVLSILEDAFKYLNDDGELWFVIRKDQGAKSVEKHLKCKYCVNIIEKDKGFYIFRTKKVDF